jgi:integrase
MKLSDLIEKYNEERVAQRNGNWKVPNGDITKGRRLVEILGDVPCAQVTRDDARLVRSRISKLPANSAPYRGWSVDRLLEKEHASTISKTQVKHYMTFYASLFKWAVQEEYGGVAKNPFERLSSKRQSGEKQQRDPFDSDELRRIFSGPLFTDYNNRKHQSHRYWAPLIGLHTGARPAEIAALTIDDIYTEVDSDDREVWIMDINTKAEDPSMKEGSRKRVKTDNAIRTVPLHPKLIELGLPDFVEEIRRRGKRRLFHHLNWSERSGYGRWIGDHFTDYLKELKIHVKYRKVFYSFRHSMATALERAEVQIHHIERLSGRSTDRTITTGERHYIAPREAKELYDQILKLDFSKELSNLRPFMEMLKS